MHIVFFVAHTDKQPTSIPCLWYRYESIIATLCENLDTLDEPEAKASMIWIIGEYAERIDNADELLEQFLETFPEETSLVSLAQIFLVPQTILYFTTCSIVGWLQHGVSSNALMTFRWLCLGSTTATGLDAVHHPALKSISAYLVSLPT